MGGSALLVYIIFALLGSLALGVFLIMMLIAIVKKSKSLAKKACVVVLVYVSVLIIFFILDGIWAMRFDFMPQLAVHGNQVTVLNSGTGSMGSQAVYVCFEDGSLSVEKVEHVDPISMKESLEYLMEEYVNEHRKAVQPDRGGI